MTPSRNLSSLFENLENFNLKIWIWNWKKDNGIIVETKACNAHKTTNEDGCSCQDYATTVFV